MTWDAYTGFSVAAGMALFVLALLPGQSAGSRLLGVLGGAAFVAYGVYVGQQTSGTYGFPVVIFVLPFVAAAKMIGAIMAGASRPSGRGTLGPPAQYQRMGVLAPAAPPAPLVAASTCPNPDCRYTGAATADRHCGWCSKATVPLAPAPVPAPVTAPFPAAAAAARPSTCPNPDCRYTGAATADRYCGWCSTATVPLTSVPVPAAVPAPLPATSAVTPGLACHNGDCHLAGQATTNRFCEQCGQATAPVQPVR